MNLPLPPHEYQELVCGPGGAKHFGAVARWMKAFLDYESLILDKVSFLDVGCGCGRIARKLVESPIASYRGFDRHEGMVNWCQKEIASRDSRFSFDFFPIRSVYEAWDKQAGALDEGSFVFPYADSSFDAALLASVFTHMSPAGVRNYLKELSRVMRPQGRVVLSIFFCAGSEREEHDEGVNIFYPPSAFYDELGRLPWDVRRVAHEFSQATPEFEPVPGRPEPACGGYKHNWHVLTRREV